MSNYGPVICIKRLKGEGIIENALNCVTPIPSLCDGDAAGVKTLGIGEISS